MSRPIYSCYSVDASVMIALHRHFQPQTWQPVWDEISRLVATGRWRLFERVVRREIRDLPDWFRNNPAAVVPFDERFNDYMNALMRGLHEQGIQFPNPFKMNDDGDPFVIALALMLEERELPHLNANTRQTTCCVLTEEKFKREKVNIPYICRRYDLACMNLASFMQHHGWSVSLVVDHPD